MVDEARLPDGEVTVAIDYSTLNYKDGMILNGVGRLVRTYPHVPGVDFAGHCRELRRAGLKNRRQGPVDAMAGRRNPMGRFAEKARVRRII